MQEGQKSNARKYGPAAAIGTAVLAVAAAFTQPQEGTVYHTYRDPGPKGIITACSGHTDPSLRLGMNYTPEECRQMMTSDLQKHWNWIVPCFKQDISVEEGIAYLDAAYNAGAGAVCKSPMVIALNSGDHAGGCRAFVGWRETQAGVYLPGLHNRRVRESAQCMLGVKK